MNDLNKTPLTHEVTKVAAQYLDDRGFKPVETEVYMPRCADQDKGWIADIAGIICPTQTELIDLGLLKNKPRWIWPTTPAYEAKTKAWDDAYDAIRERFNHESLTTLVEVKTSRADFRGDRKWTALCPTNLAYLAIPKGIAKENEWPAGWGILEYHEGAIKRLKIPEVRPVSHDQFVSVLYQIAIRRDHHTRYARWREILQEGRKEDAQNRKNERMRKIARLMVRVANGEGESLEFLLARAGHSDLPEYVMEPIRELWGMAAKNVEVSA